MPTPEEEAAWAETDRILPIPDAKPTPHHWPKPEPEWICPVSGTTTCTASPKTWREAHGISERAYAVYVDQRRSTPDAVAEVIRISIAEELRRQADEFEATRQEWREEDSRTLRSSGLGHAVQALRARADALDPEGAAR